MCLFDYPSNFICELVLPLYDPSNAIQTGKYNVAKRSTARQAGNYAAAYRSLAIFSRSASSALTKITDFTCEVNQVNKLTWQPV